jgi:hypothetical protein
MDWHEILEEIRRTYMDPFTMMLVGGGMQAVMGTMGARNSAQQAGLEAQRQKDQIDWANHINQLDTDAQNRDIASANAAKWMNNQLISQIAHESEGEQLAWSRMNFDNETGFLSSQSNKVNQELIAGLSNKNITGGTAKARVREARQHLNRIMSARSVSNTNKERDIRRKKDEMLSRRDFNYNRALTFMPASTAHIDPAAASKSAYQLGMAQTLMSSVSSGMQFYGMAQQNNYLDSLINPPTGVAAFQQTGIPYAPGQGPG